MTLLLAGGAFGCSDDSNSDGNSNNIIPGNNENPDAQAADVQDASDARASDASDASDTPNPDDGGDATQDQCPQTPCGAGQVCDDGTCVDETPAIKCAGAEDLGTLDITSSLTASGTFTDASDILEASCADADDTPEKVFRFVTAEDSRIDFDVTWNGNFAAVVEFRTSCDDSTSSLSCRETDSAIAFVPAGTEVFMVVEMAQGVAGDFAVELTATAETCPQGQQSCSSGELEICSGGGQSDTYSCADACGADAESCAGDVCSEAISVTQTQTFSGDLAAYTSKFNFDGASFCESPSGTAIPTPGNDIIFALPNLTTSDTVTIDAETNDDNVNAIFIMTQDPCSSTPQCVRVEGTQERFDFTPSADGTHYVIIDKTTESSGAFNYSFTYQ